MNTDPIADLLTRIRNAQQAGHRYVELPSSKMKETIVKLLMEEGYIRNYQLKDEPEGRFKVMRLTLKYDKNGEPAIQDISRVSRPGLRRYANKKKMPRVLNGAGIAIMSTNKGLLTDRAARRENVGGEVLCYVQ